VSVGGVNVGAADPAVSREPRPYGPEGIVAALLFIGVVTTMLLQIIGRIGVFDPPIWTEELSRWLWVWMVCFGMAEVERRNEHLAVDFLVTRLPALPRKAVLLVTDLVYLAVMGGLIWIGTIGVIRALPSQSVTMPTSDAVLYASFPVAAVFIALRILLRLIERIRQPAALERAAS
jgi:TRAP-type C4-dicarboxylate transport system permease small subunit